MHAASVYPEPGSNSLLIVLYRFLRNVTIEFVCSAYFCTFCKVCSSYLKEFSRTLFVSLLFNFQCPRSPFSLGLSPSPQAASLVYTIYSRLSIPFFKFFQVFLFFFSSCLPSAPLLCALGFLYSEKSFSPHLPSVSTTPCISLSIVLAAALAATVRSIPHHLPIVKWVFSLFSTFLFFGKRLQTHRRYGALFELINKTLIYNNENCHLKPLVKLYAPLSLWRLNTNALFPQVFL